MSIVESDVQIHWLDLDGTTTSLNPFIFVFGPCRFKHLMLRMQEMLRGQGEMLALRDAGTRITLGNCNLNRQPMKLALH